MPEQITIYIWDSNGYYLGTATADRDQLEWELNSVERHLIPQNGTDVAPDPFPVPSDKIAHWNGVSWDQEDKPPNSYIIKTGITKQLAFVGFFGELLDTFPGAQISSTISLDSSSAKDIRFDNITDTIANNTTIDSLITNHDFSEGKRPGIKAEVKKLMNNDDWKFKRHRDQLACIAVGDKSETWNYPKFSSFQFRDWCLYYDDLRPFDQNCTPDTPTWPVAPKEFRSCTANKNNSTFTCTGHGLQNDNKIEIRAEALPNGINKDTEYYVINQFMNNTFQLSATQGGDAVTFSTNGTNVQFRKRYVPL